MIVLACGGRSFGDRAFLEKVLDHVHAKRPITLLVEGGAAGADRLAREWAEGRGIPVQTFPADWDRYGHRAGPVRNREMYRTAAPRLVVAFAGGAGTADMIRVAAAGGTPVLRTWRYEDGFENPKLPRPMFPSSQLPSWRYKEA